MSAAKSAAHITEVNTFVLTAVYGNSIGVPIYLSSNYTDRVSGIQPGETRIQTQTYVSGMRAVDSNLAEVPVVTTLVTVVRAILAGSLDEVLYVGDHMPWTQERLLTPKGWRGLSTVFDLDTDPIIDLEPERSGAIIRYRTRVSAVLNAS